MSDSTLSSSSRRNFLKTFGSLTIAIPFLPACFESEEKLPYLPPVSVNLEELPGSLRRTPHIQSWLKVLADGRVQIFSGKVELGQGIRIAIKQVAAEELYMDLNQVEVILAETGVTPNEGYTAGSGSIKDSATAVRYAAAAAREKLIELAAQKLGVPADELQPNHGFIETSDRSKKLSFAEILDGKQIEDEVPLTAKLKPKSAYQYVGKAISREDVPKMIRGEGLYIHDLRFPEMVHARVLRPFNYQSELIDFDTAGFKGEAEGIMHIVRIGNFLGVITQTEYQAEKAVELLARYTQWSEPKIFPPQDQLADHIKQIASQPEIAHGEGANLNSQSANQVLNATYFKPYTMHGAMGPACGIAMFDGEILHIWSHSQGIYPMREGIASMLGLEVEKIHVISSPGSGAYGHTVADDAAADAAILAMDFPGRHVRVRWSRQDEHRWEPYGSAMRMALEAGLDENGKIKYWSSDIWTDSHSTRPNKEAATLLPARYLNPPVSLKSRGYLAGGHRNGDPYYVIPEMQIRAHYFDGPLRVSSLRSLGSFGNIFAIESFMDELAEKAGKDPIEFRVEHSSDQRAIDVIRKVQTMIKSVETGPEEGIGFAFSRYKNYDSYCAMAMKVKVDSSTGKVKLLKCWTAVDVGEVINLDGIKNQIEGGIVQAAAWTLAEEVKFSKTEITSVDWASYDILRYKDTPEIEVAVIDRPEEPAMGGGEVSTPPVAAAICNAIYRAVGKRVYELPVRI
ncbi:MAG: molybdopterin cofactor-binding domain-containing protein [Bacteroidia bacterium]